MTKPQNPLLFFRDRYLSRLAVFGLYLFLSFFASVVVLLLVSIVTGINGIAPMEGLHNLQYLIASLLASAIALFVFRTDRIIIRRIGARDMITFVSAAVLKGVLMIAPLLFFREYSMGHGIVIGFDVVCTAMIIIMTQIAMLMVWDHFNRKSLEKYQHRRVVIYGTSEKSLAAAIRLRNSIRFKAVGVLDKQVSGRILDGLPVFHAEDEEEMEAILIKNRVDAVLFPSKRDIREEEDRLLPFCNSKGIACLIVPSVDKFTESDTMFAPREVRIEDLLGREEIEVSLDAIKSNFMDKTVMVTGAAGSIGSELCRQLAGFGAGKLILYDNAETPTHYLRLELEEKYPWQSFVPVIGDVRFPERLDFAFRTYRPQIVFHAAAYKHVPLMEENPCEAVLVNVFGTRNVASKCLEYGVESMVMISTDKAVNPTNIMGCTKRLAEIYVQSLGLATQQRVQNGGPAPTRFVTTRFGNVLGSNGSVIPRFKEQIAKGGPITVTHPEINRFFMTIPEACRLVMEAATMSEGNQIFVFDMGKAVKIVDLAEKMIRLAGLEPGRDIKIKFTGLRPGEKLYEEVLADAENTLPSFHKRIRIAKVREYTLEDIDPAQQRLIQLAQAVRIPEMVALMKELVPEFTCSTNFTRNLRR